MVAGKQGLHERIGVARRRFGVAHGCLLGAQLPLVSNCRSSCSAGSASGVGSTRLSEGSSSSRYAVGFQMERDDAVPAGAARMGGRRRVCDLADLVVTWSARDQLPRRSARLAMAIAAAAALVGGAAVV